MLYWFCTLTKPGRAVGRGRRRLLEHGAREVGAAELADLALGHQLAQGAQRLGDRRLRVGEVQLVEVDAVGAEAGQAVLDRRAHVGRRRAALVPLVGRAELGGQHDLVAPCAQGGAEIRLALGAPVDVRRVEEA